jgi:hypothetical protein
MRRVGGPWWTALVVLAASGVSAVASGLPVVGVPRPAFTLVDAWDRPLRVDAAANRPLLVIYEDRVSADQNTALKEELAKLARSDPASQAVGLIAVADVSQYDYWPARGFVKRAIRDESKRFGTTIYCDWDGAARRALGLHDHLSSVVLFGRSGRVLLSHEGPMPPEKRRELFALLHAEATD